MQFPLLLSLLSYIMTPLPIAELMLDSKSMNPAFYGE